MANEKIAESPPNDDLLHHAKEALSAELMSRKDLAAGQVNRLADRLKTIDLTHLVDDIGNFARREPILFLGGAFALGVIASRFLKATPSRIRDDIEPTGGL